MTNKKNFFKKKRQWSIIKDNLLGHYLKPYFQKLLRTRKPICYIDCFAGKGKFDDGKEGSPLIALQKREEAIVATHLLSHPPIDMIFIESEYANELEHSINECHINCSKTVINGKYEENIISLLRTKLGQNIFLYIDPYGISSLDFNIFSMLSSYQFNSIEILLNFNSFGFFRVACKAMNTQTRVEEAFQDLDKLVERETIEYTPNQCEILLNRVAGGDYWKEIVEDYKNGEINGFQAEKRLSTEYKNQLKKHFNYVLDMPIMLKSGQRPKYRMIHACNHRDGYFLMADNMIQRKNELYIKIHNDFLGNKFSDEGEYINTEGIKERTYELFKRADGEVCLEDFMVSFVDTYGLICEFKEIYAVLENMEGAGEIIIMRTPEKTKTGRKSTFWKLKDKNKIILRKNNA